MRNKGMIPIQGKTYYCYDDGKVRISRQYLCTIDSVIPFEKICKEIEKGWREAVKENEHLFASTTDYIIKATVKDDVTETQYFARTTYGGWFSFAIPLEFDVGSSLDADGSLTLGIMRSYKKSRLFLGKDCPQKAEIYTKELATAIEDYMKLYKTRKNMTMTEQEFNELYGDKTITFIHCGKLVEGIPHYRDNEDENDYLVCPICGAKCYFEE